MKTCKEIREVLAEMLDEGFEGAFRTEVEMHLSSCLECNKQYQQMRKIRDVLKSQPEMQVSASFSAGLAAKIQNQTGTKVFDLTKGKTHKINHGWSKLFAYAAGFGIMAVSFVALQQQGLFKESSPLPQINNQPVLSQEQLSKKEKTNIVAQSKDSVKTKNKNDTLKHLKFVTPNEDKIYRVSHGE